MEVVQELAGHSTPEMTEHYQHVALEVRLEKLLQHKEDVAAIFS